MKAITLTSPWGTLIAIGAKRIETRSWSTTYRGQIAIHQAKGLNGLRQPEDGRLPNGALEQRLAELCDSDPFFTVLRPHLSGYTAAERAADLPRGRIVAIANLVDVVETGRVNFAMNVVGLDAPDQVMMERAFGDYTPGRYAWLLDNVLAINSGIECIGGVGLWNVPAATLEELAEVVEIA